MKHQLNRTRKRQWMVMLSLLMVSLLAAPNAFGAANDTDAGATISNTATIVYAIGGTDQDPETSNTVDFLVDHKVRPLVAMTGDSTTANNATDAYLTFTVTNDGNTAGGALHMRLTAEESVADNFNVAANSIRIYEDTNGDGDLDIGTGDTLVTDYNAGTFGTISVDREDTGPSNAVTVFVVANMPNGQAHNNTAVVHLIATAWDTAGIDVGAFLPEDTDGDSPAVVEVVWADDQSTLPSGDTGLGAVPTAPDGKHAALATFTIQATALGVVKSSSVESDPFGNVAPDAYRVPGARVQYDIVVTNTGAVAADNVRLVDQIPAGTDYINGSFTADAGATIAYSNDTTTVLPALPTDWTHTPTWDANGVDAAITWIRITLGNPVAGSGGSVTSTFDVFIR